MSVEQAGAVCPGSTAACPAFFRPPCPCRRLAATGRRRSRVERLLDRCSFGLLRTARNAIEERTPGRTPARRYTPAERRRQGGQTIVREADTALRSCARSANSVHSPTPLLHTAGRQARTGHGGAVLRRAGECGRPVRPGTRRRGRPRSGRPQAPLESVEKFLTGTVLPRIPVRSALRAQAGLPAWVDCNPAGYWRSRSRCDRCASQVHQLRSESGSSTVNRPARRARLGRPAVRPRACPGQRWSRSTSSSPRS
jgi:hypothetical protein